MNEVRSATPGILRRIRSSNLLKAASGSLAPHRPQIGVIGMLQRHVYILNHLWQFCDGLQQFVA